MGLFTEVPPNSKQMEEGLDFSAKFPGLEWGCHGAQAACSHFFTQESQLQDFPPLQPV